MLESFSASGWGLIVVLLVTAHFAAYTFVRPALEELPQMSPHGIGLLLLLHGAFGLIGNFAAGAAAGHKPRETVLLLAAGITLAITVVASFGANAPVAGVAVALRGVAHGGFYG